MRIGAVRCAYNSRILRSLIATISDPTAGWLYDIILHAHVSLPVQGELVLCEIAVFSHDLDHVSPIRYSVRMQEWKWLRSG